MMAAKLGKIDIHLFKQFIGEKCGFENPNVRVKPGFGLDVSVIGINDCLAIALTSDPLTLIPSLGLEESAWLSVHLMANDMATTGFAPQYGQFVLNLPATFSSEDFNVYWNYIHRFCKEIGLSITGGHTGFIEGQNSTIVGGGTFMTIAPEKSILVSSNAQVGDSILVTKSAALSSTAILALSFPETVKNKLGIEVYEEAADSFYQTSALKEALAAVKINGAISAMHDVTEGGVLGAIYEMASSSQKGCLVDNKTIPIGHAQNEVCRLFEIDPLYCIGAGSMIIACKPEKVAQVQTELGKKMIACREVGKFTPHESGIKVITKEDKIQNLNYQEEDPYWAAFFLALKKGLK